jgi:hypothetical protein
VYSSWAKVAVTAVSALTMKQPVASIAAPDHDTNRQPAAGAAVKESFEPLENVWPAIEGFVVTTPPAAGAAIRVTI